MGFKQFSYKCNEQEKEDIYNSFFASHYLSTLIGFSKSRDSEIYDYHGNKLLIIGNFAFALDLKIIANFSTFFEDFKNFFLIMPKTFNDTSSLPEFVKTQQRAHFTNFKLNESLFSSLKDDEVLPINRELFNRICADKNYINHLREFESFENFDSHGSGFVILEENEIKAIASTFCNYNNHVEIQVDTLEGNRTKGLATKVTMFLLNDCIKKGFTPHWDAANKISESLGEKVGFLEPKKYFWLYTHKI